jgi:type VI secretion system Hcp family effector
MSNSNNQPLSYATAYNIVFSHGAFTPKSQDTAIIPTVGQGPATGINSTTVLPGIWITVKGAAQGLFKPSEQVKGLEDKIRSISYEMEILRPTDIVSGMTTLNKNYAPIIIKKLAGPSSLQFIQALKTNETLTSVTLEVVAMFTNKIIYKIILTNAIVSYFKQSFEGTPNLLTDFIKLTFQKIEFDYSYPVIQVTDMWNPPAN